MRFMLLQNYGAVELGLPADGPEWSPGEIKAHIEFQQALNAELAKRGELVDAQGLAGPEQAKFVRLGRVGAPVVTDGPFPESKELLAGYRLIDVETPRPGHRDRRPGVGCAWTGRGGDPPADRGTPGAQRSRPRGVTTAVSTEDLLRELAPQVLGALVRRYGDFADSEDAVQEALLAAATTWPAEGQPDNPLGVAYSCCVPPPGRTSTAATLPAVAGRNWPPRGPSTPPEPAPGRDDTLILMFMCCHPSLTPASAIPLTLRAVGGLTTREIAAAFLVPEATMAQRISRAKAKIKASGEPFTLPLPDQRPERLRSVLHALYLLFNEGYATSGGPGLSRTDLSGEAIRLARIMQVAAARGPGGGRVARADAAHRCPPPRPQRSRR